MSPSQIRRAVRILAGMGIHTAAELMATGKTLREVKV